jgi:hypothetical protein
MEIEDYKRAYREVAKHEERRAFIAHLVSCILLNTLMFLLISSLPKEFCGSIFHSYSGYRTFEPLPLEC